MDRIELEKRTKKFALQVIDLTTPLFRVPETAILARQLFRSGTAIGSIYREAARAGTRRDFIHKLNLSVKEASETVYWLELLVEGSILKQTATARLKNGEGELLGIAGAALLDEAGQLLRILAAGFRTAKVRAGREKHSVPQIPPIW